MRKKCHRSRLLNPFNCFWSDLFIAKRYKRKLCKRGKIIPTEIPTGIRCQAASGRVPFTALKRFNAFLKGNSTRITDWLNKFSSIAERNTVSDSLMSNISKNLSISATKSTYIKSGRQENLLHGMTYNFFYAINKLTSTNEVELIL